ncbi:hypothetical protein Hanom_Chr08g00742611 [Helianthus anomalus]
MNYNLYNKFCVVTNDLACPATWTRFECVLRLGSTHPLFILFLYLYIYYYDYYYCYYL